MREAYARILGSDRGTRREAYQAAIEQWPTTPFLIEKDLMVCAVLDVLFGDVADASERLVFKGGTSLSKVHGLIERFSEDIDLVVVRSMLGFKGDHDPLNIEAEMSGKRREKLFAELRGECASYMRASLVPALEDALGPHGCRVEIDADDPQTLLVHYESATEDPGTYNQPAIKVEGGARSATLPAHAHTIRPYVSSVMTDGGPETLGVVTIDAERTFLDKLVILHGRHCRFRDLGDVYRNANRESRHYYDLAMMEKRIAARALARKDLLHDVIEHAKIGFSSGWKKLDEAAAGQLLIRPQDEMAQAMRADYAKMSDMILGEPPSFDEVLEAIARIGSCYAEI